MKAPSESIWTRNFICASIANMMLALSHTSVNTLASTYAAYLGAGAVLVGALTGIFFGVAVAMRPIAGPLTVRINSRKLMICVYTLGAFVNLGYAAFGSIGWFLVFRVLNGIQYSIIGSLTMMIASDSLPKSKVASGIGAFCIGSSVAQALGPSFGVMIKEFGTNIRGESFGFTLVFLFASLMMMLSLIPCFCLRDMGKPKISSGSVWYKEIVSLPALAPAFAMALIMMSYSLFSAYMVPYAGSKGISGIGLFFTVLALCLMITRPLSGKIADKRGLFVVSLPGVVLFSLSFILIAIGNNLAIMLAAAVVASLTFGAAYPGIQTMCMQSDTPERSGVASNTLFLGVDIGYFFGPLLGSIIYSNYSYSAMYLSGVIPCIASGLIISLAWPAFKKRRISLDARVEAE